MHRGWRGFGFGFGPRGFTWARGPRRRQWFEAGDMKYVILKLLKDKPRHGYEVMKELEERMHGCYSPSPGTVYPTLQWLEDEGLVVAKEVEGEWKGDYEMMGYTRHATMKFAGRGTEGIPIEFTIVGKKVNNVPISLVTQDGDFVTVKSEEFRITFALRSTTKVRAISGKRRS